MNFVTECDLRETFEKKKFGIGAPFKFMIRFVVANLINLAFRILGVRNEETEKKKKLKKIVVVSEIFLCKKFLCRISSDPMRKEEQYSQQSRQLK